VTGQASLRGKWASVDDFLRDFDQASLDHAATLVNDSVFYDIDKIFQLGVAGP
jgi:hypothetical protein